MARRWRCIVLLAICTPVAGAAGEIAGLAPQFPPYLERDFEITFGNDFFGRGGRSDNFRTQQLIINAKLSDRWTAILDHSILTLGASPTPSRVDQLSGSLGYAVIDAVNDRLANKLVVGVGIRNVGDFAGQRIQNGFHRLVASEIKTYPYVDTQSSDATAWFDADHFRSFGKRGEVGNWRTGYWLRGSSLITSDGQWDAAAGIYAVATRPAIDAWLGVRRDWRSGYESAVLAETAAAEDDVAIVLGARLGPILFETVQQLNNDASYGQVRLISSGFRDTAARNGDARLGLTGSILAPDVQLRLTGSYRTRLFTAAGSSWREAVIATVSYGEPQYEDNANIFTRSQQLEVGLDLERPLPEQSGWLSVYGSAGAGWRSERLIGANALQGEKSGSVGRAVLSLGAGLRFDAASLGEQWRFRMQLGLHGRLPFQDASLRIGDAALPVQQAALDVVFGMSLEFE